MTAPDARAAGGKATQVNVALPAPTAWPVVLGFGVTLLFAGLVTSESLSILGAVLMIAGCAGWFREVLPHEKHQVVPAEAAPLAVSIATSRRQVARLPLAPDLPRALLPLELYPVSAGIKGGLAGSVGMAMMASLYGLLKQSSIWYPINLLAASAELPSLKLTPDSLRAFHGDAFALACLLHLVTSVLVGLLYGAMLPMFPRRPILLGGVIAPVLWTGLLHSVLELLNPVLNDRIDWRWFIASQCAFGVVAGLVVVRQNPVRTRQIMPFSVLAGIEAPGAMHERSGEDAPK
ncbi:MAG TPA: hypothetical protein VL099_12570 [Candidatus Binatia bacterium]|nr:hypothetical protein [Candidatus Binatia bacterium]